MKNMIREYLKANENNIISDVIDLVRINSIRTEPWEGEPYGKEIARALHLALYKAERMGFRVNNYNNYVGTVDLNEGESCLDILAHLDVVPAQESWTVTAPFEPVVIDNVLYGRGVSDDKGPAIAALYAMKAIKDLEIPLFKNVRLILGTDEECGGSDLSYYYGIEKEAPMTFTPDAAFPLINGEKGIMQGEISCGFDNNMVSSGIIWIHGGKVINAVPEYAEAKIAGVSSEVILQAIKSVANQTQIKFNLKADGNSSIIEASGKSAHAAGPEEGNNALTGLLALLCKLPFPISPGQQRIEALHTIFPHNDWKGEAAGISMQDSFSGELTISLTILDYEQGHLKASFDSRTPLCATAANTKDVISDRVKELGLVMEKINLCPPHYVSSDSDFVKTLLTCYEEVTGKNGQCICCKGATYVHNLQNGVAYGCIKEGLDTHMHGADEFMPVEDIIAGAEIYALSIIKLCGKDV